MSEFISIECPGMQRLHDNMERYFKLQSKTIEDATLKQTNNLRVELYKEYKKEAPLSGQSYQEWKGRTAPKGKGRSAIGYRIGERGAPGKLSQRAWDLADSIMGGQKAVWGSVSGGEYGNALRLTTARMGSTRAQKRIIGGRFARLGKAGTVAWGRAHSRGMYESVLNRRAVATFYELKLREVARGYTSASFLAKQWARKRDPDTNLPKRTLITNRLKSEVIGEVGYDVFPDGVRAFIKSYVQGSSKHRQAAVRAIANVNADIEDYMRRKLEKAALLARVK
jgi:hypothetical protein